MKDCGGRHSMSRCVAVRCSLAEELVVAAQGQDVAAAAAQDAAAARQQAQDLVERLAAAEELLGEREEELSELQADLEDVKQVGPQPYPSSTVILCHATQVLCRDVSMCILLTFF